jgi:glutamate N-acetyltransferase / amino-acid N-acetyltransferase
MMMELKDLDFLGPKGVWVGSLAAGIKKSGKPDIALLISSKNSSFAGVFTPNKLSAAPVKYCQEILGENGYCQGRAILVSSGNANAATGQEGFSLVQNICTLQAELIGSQPSSVLIAQTGLIGVPLPAKIFKDGVKQLTNCYLSSSFPPNGAVKLAQWQEAAEGMMTTDTFPKVKAIRLDSEEIIDFFGEPITIVGIAKGVAMHSPSMATMIATIVTDAKIEPHVLAALLRSAVNCSFNCVNIDGCMSTNDTVFAVTSQIIGKKSLTEEDTKLYSTLLSGFKLVARELALLMARDAEGGSKLVNVVVEGARSVSEAQVIAKQVVGSVLVKCAIAGECPYWGRVFAEVGAALVEVSADLIDIYFGPYLLCSQGIAKLPVPDGVYDYLRGDSIQIKICLGLGSSVGESFGSDLTHEYVSINMDKS